MLLIAFGVVVCALGEANLVMKGLVQQLVALLFEVRKQQQCSSVVGRACGCLPAWNLPMLPAMLRPPRWPVCTPSMLIHRLPHCLFL